MTAACTRESHEQLKTSRALFEASVKDPHLWDPDDEKPLLIGECLLCNSTLGMYPNGDVL